MPFNDFIPAGDRLGGAGSGFSDFVPEEEKITVPKGLVEPENPVEESKPEEVKKDEPNEIDEALANPVTDTNTLDGIKGIGKASVEKLKKINITTPEQLVQMSDEQLASIVGKLNVKKMKNACMQIIAGA